jgi:Na+:H+ antiporter, NhaA family
MAPVGLTATFTRFVESERAGGFLLLACTFVALMLANSPLGPAWLELWQVRVLGLTLQHWVNDALMAVFFLLVGLELEREIYVGELSVWKNALLPIVAALGGVAAPAAFHFALNVDTPSQPGAGIPMATDIAFALAALSLAGKAVPVSLKVFLTALAVIDDLVAIAVIGLAYSGEVAARYLGAAFVTFVAMLALNRLRVSSLAPYLAGGVLLWFFMLRSGVHPTVAGVLLAFAIPFRSRDANVPTPSERAEHALHRPVALLVLPVFALANAGVVLPSDWQGQLLSSNSIGIAGGLLLGKPVGILVACMIAVRIGLCELPGELRWRHIFGAGLLAGIGFTMSIFIANLAFPTDAQMVNGSKLAILAASALAAVLGVAWLRLAARAAVPRGEG